MVEGEEVGSIFIRAAWDGGAVEEGLNRMNRELERTQDAASTVFNDLEALIPSANQLGRAFTLMGGLATAGIGSIIAASPMLQAKMSEIGIAIAETLRQVAPAFAPILDNLLDKIKQFRDWIGTLDMGSLEKAAKLATVLAGVGTGMVAGGAVGSTGVNPGRPSAGMPGAGVTGTAVSPRGGSAIGS